MTKLFTQFKVGYSSGMYGCSNEYFTLIYTDASGLHSINHYGLYGSDERVARAMKERGYTQQHVQSPNYGKMSLREAKPYFISEDQAIKEAQEIK